MAVAPALDPNAIPGPLRRRYALLINPFYRKDPHASFGKHVLTPTLALTAIAAATPAALGSPLLGREPAAGSAAARSVPGGRRRSRVHLTFAKRAYELARWYRQWGAKVVLGGLHVLVGARRSGAARGRDRARRRRAALAADSRGRRGGHAAARLPRRLSQAVSRRSGAAPRPAAARRLSHDVERHRDARLPQPLRVLLSLDRGAAHAVPAARRRASRRGARSRRAAVRRVRRQQLGLAARLPARALPRARAARDHLERRAHDRRDGRSDARARDGARRLHGRVHRLRIAERRQHLRTPASARRCPTTTRAASRSCTTTASR